MRFQTKILSTLAFASVIFASTAKADLLLEPYVGYGLVSINNNLKAQPGDQTDGGGGVVIGGRLGVAMPLVWFAADYSMGTYSMKNVSAAPGRSNADYTTAADTLYAVAGIKIPLIQAYAGYGFLDNATLKYTGGDTKVTGNAVKFGVGFTGFPIISLNLEYQIHTYTKYTPANGTETDVSTSYDKFNSNVILLSVSAPFRF